MFTYRYFFWDVESTSSSPMKDDIISLGGVLAEYNRFTKKFIKIAEFHSYVSTPKQISPGALAVHHITPDMLIGQPTFPEMIEKLIEFHKEHQKSHHRLIMIAHNGSRFDDIMLYCNFVEHRMFFEDFLKSINCYGFVDSIKFLKSILKNSDCQPVSKETGRVSYALGCCYTSYCVEDGSKLKDAHDALVDSIALYKVFDSPKVSCKFSQTELIKFVVLTERTIENLRKSSSIVIREREQTYLNDYKNPKGPEETVVYDDQPKFDDSSEEKRLCLNCLLYVSTTEHRTCDISCPKCDLFVSANTSCENCHLYFCGTCKVFGQLFEHRHKND